MKKFINLLLITVMGFMIIPSVWAKEGLEATITLNPGKDTVLDGSVCSQKKDAQGNITITCDTLNLKMIDKDKDSLNRGIDAAWPGFKINKPAKASSKPKVRRGGEIKDVEADGLYFYAITKEKLEKALAAGEKIVFSWEFDWDYSGTRNEDFEKDQTITLIIDPTKVILIAKDSNEVLFNGIEEAKKLNPNTADNLYLLIGLFIFSSIGLGCTIKKFNN